MTKWTPGQLGKTNPIQTQFKANSNPIQTQLNPKQNQFKPKQTQYKPKQTQYKPKQTQFQSQYMLPRLTINTRHMSLGYYTNEIEATNACDRAAMIACFISLSVARFIDSSLMAASGKPTVLSDILTKIGLKSRERYLPYQIVASDGRFLLTKWAIFYSIEVLETNTYKGLLFISLVSRNRGLHRFNSVFLVLGSKFKYWRSGPAEMILCMLTDQPDCYRTPKKSFLEKVQC